jgi:pimeloyl-ACP methyl ester carboxylesterase
VAVRRGGYGALTVLKTVPEHEHGGAMIEYRTIEIEGHEVFYREAGNPERPTLLLLEGFPSSSAQYERLMRLLADRFHLVAPDYPGFGRSPALGGETTFERLAEVMDAFTRAKRLARFSVYMFDFGAPVGFRLAIADPERIEALVIQNGNAYEAGLGPGMQALRPYWADRAGHEAAIRGLLQLEVTRSPGGRESHPFTGREQSSATDWGEVRTRWQRPSWRANTPKSNCGPTGA